MDPNQDDEYLDADDNEEDLLDERNILRVIDLPDEGIIGYENEGYCEDEQYLLHIQMIHPQLPPPLSPHLADSDEQDMEMGEGEEEEGAEGGDQTPVEDMAAIVFRAHTEKPHSAEELPEVYAVHIDPTHSGRVVTGGRDDSAYVWNITTGQVIFECTGHKNSVSCVGFSHDGLYVASADLDGLIRVWHCEKKELAWSFDCGSDIMWLQWHHSAHVLLVGTSDGDMWMWKIPGGECKTFQSHGTQSLCGKVLPDGKTACVGYADGVVKLWDLKENKAQFTWRHFTPAAVSGGRGEDEDEEEEKAAILSIDCSPDNSLVISGCADATAKIFNAVSGMLVSSWNCAVNRDQDNAVEAVGFSPVAAYAATGTNSGAVEVWDLPKSSVRHTLQHPAGVCKLQWSSSSYLLYTACLDGILRTWDTRSGSCKAVWTGHVKNASLLDFSLSRDESCLVSASEDGTARVFRLQP